MAPGCSWLLLALLAAPGCSWLLLGSPGCSWLLSWLLSWLHSWLVLAALFVSVYFVSPWHCLPCVGIPSCPCLHTVPPEAPKALHALPLPPSLFSSLSPIRHMHPTHHPTHYLSELEVHSRGFRETYRYTPIDVEDSLHNLSAALTCRHHKKIQFFRLERYNI